MWTEEKPSYNGKYYWIKEVSCPKPVQKPHPPIMIAGGGEKMFLKIVAKHADIAYPTFSYQARKGRVFRAIEDCRHKLTVLKKHCETIGRDYDKIEKS